MRERKTGTLRLADQRYRYDRAGAIIEHVVTEDEYRTQASLFAAADRVEVGPTNFAPQYSGHASISCPKPSSARAFSNFGSSFAHSDARRLRSMRASFSATAAWIARLRLGKTLFETRLSTRLSVSRSMVIATFTLPMVHLYGMTIDHTITQESPE